MIRHSPNQHQPHLFLPRLSEFINPRHELCLLADKIDWHSLETDFAVFYAADGAPAKPIRLMVGLLILKQLYDLGDETVMNEWVSNPYFQSFCGEVMFQWEFPCDPSDLVHFRHRIGVEGVERILALSILIHGREVLKEAVSFDTTVQEKNITFPTETKLAVKIIKQCQQIANSEGIRQRRSYRREAKQLLRQAQAKSAKQTKAKRKARKRLQTMAGAVVRELRRQLNVEGLVKYGEKLELMERVLKQKKDDKDKIYSLHAPEVSCIAKGKAHKKYEFGSKVAIGVTQKSNVLVVALSRRGNPNDNKMLEKMLEQPERVTGVRAKRVYTDRGCVSQQIGETEVISPSSGAGKSASEKARLRKAFRRRAAIEPDIGHLKSDYGLERNYLKGEVGDEMNALLSASAFNFRSWVRKAVGGLLFWFKILRRVWCESDERSNPGVWRRFERVCFADNENDWLTAIS